MTNAKDYHQFVSILALENSRLRKLDGFDRDVLDAIPSSPPETERDWSGAVGRYLDWLLTAPFPFSSLDESLLDCLQNAWLDDLKEFKAYLRWRSSWTTHGVWTPTSQQDENFIKACLEIQELFNNEEIKRPVAEFAIARRHIEDNFLCNGRIAFGKPLTRDLIASKARRIWERTKSSDELRNWVFAENYVKDFYENIINAVEQRRTENVRTVLRALNSGPSGENLGITVSALEALLAVRFLDNSVMSAS